MPAWNGHAGSEPLGEPAGAAVMGVADLVLGNLTLPSGEQPLSYFVQFPQLWDLVSSCILSQDIPGCQVFVINIWDEILSGWYGL